MGQSIGENTSITRRTGMVHTSAKSQSCNDVIVSMAMPATACPALQHPAVSPNIDESGKQSLYPDGDPDRHQNLTSCSLVNCQPSLKFHAYLFGSFCTMLLINKQTNNDENISSLAEVMNYIFHDKMKTLASLCSILYK